MRTTWRAHVRCPRISIYSSDECRMPNCLRTSLGQLFAILCAVSFLLVSAVANAQGIVTGDPGDEDVELRISPGSPALIADTPPPFDEDRVKRVDDAIERGLAIVQKAAKNYPEHRQCFACHHQTLPLLAMHEAEQAGFRTDKDVAGIIADHTAKSFSSRVNKLREGRGIGGKANTVGYGLWTLDLAAHQADETTDAMVEFLLKDQREDGYWLPPSNRPPLEESQVAVTVLSAYYMQRFTEDGMSDDVEKAILKARSWLSDAPLKSQEDHNFRLWGLTLLEDAGDGEIQKQINELRDTILSAQRKDGGWSQLPELESDAYATGQTLYILREVGLPADSAFVRSAVDCLLKSQHENGSWLVETRSKPVQIFFDNGDPHGKSQFISIAATSWATAALAAIKMDLEEGAKE